MQVATEQALAVIRSSSLSTIDIGIRRAVRMTLISRMTLILRKTQDNFFFFPFSRSLPTISRSTGKPAAVATSELVVFLERNVPC